MSIFDHIQQAAIEIADNAQARLSQLEHEEAEIDARKAKIKAERDMIRGTAHRLANFPVRTAADFLCPRCWVAEGKSSPLRPIPSQTRDDLFRCTLCQFDLMIPG